jgi:hypothetical protein
MTQETTPTLTVRGAVVPPGAVIAGLRRMWADDAFWRDDVARDLAGGGCPADVAADAAGRLMQWAKRRGLIHRPFDDYWTPTEAFREGAFPYV